MANLGKSKTLFFPTSPRSPYKLQNEIPLFITHFQGKEWNKTTQKKYASLLAKSQYYQGEISANDDFAARDRITRAPKALGLIDLSPLIEITPAGKQFLDPILSEEALTRQLVKFQLPSPYHTDKDSKYCVKPYLEILRLINDIGGLTKFELAIFGMQLIDYKEYERIKQEIIAFRKERITKHHVNKKRFISQTFCSEIKKIYAEEIAIGKTKTRQQETEDLQNFIKTKRNNMIDYADACIRYLRATGLVLFDIKSRYVIAHPHRHAELKFILTHTSRDPIAVSDEAKYKANLFDPTTPKLLSDDKLALKKSVNELEKRLKKEITYFEKEVPIHKIKVTKSKLEQELKAKNVAAQAVTLQDFKQTKEILDTYKAISEGGIVDPSLFFEWNTWRAFTMLDDGQVTGNFTTDIDGSPLGCAPPNKPDIECEYKEFCLVVEVTLSSGQKQYDMEGEPVARHYGQKRKSTIKPTYCLFVAPKINEATLAHFYALHKTSIKYYGGKAQIIPMDLATFAIMLKHAETKKKVKSEELQKYIQFLCESALSAENEQVWLECIQKSVVNWTELTQEK